jgi:hypothetical protein
MRKEFKVLLALAIIIALAMTIDYSINKSETNECKQWQKQAQETPKFYLANWQVEQCKAHQIIINVK